MLKGGFDQDVPYGRSFLVSCLCLAIALDSSDQATKIGFVDDRWHRILELGGGGGVLLGWQNLDLISWRCVLQWLGCCGEVDRREAGLAVALALWGVRHGIHHNGLRLRLGLPIGLEVWTLLCGSSYAL